MGDVVVPIAVGAVLVFLAVWWIPRQMEALRERPETDDRFDRVLRSRAYHFARGLVAVCGVVAMADGVYVALS